MISHFVNLFSTESNEMGLCMREDLETKYSRIRDFCKKEKKQFWQKISARIPHSVCLKVGNVDRIAIWSGSLGLTRAHSGSLGLARYVGV